jgi:glycosyltransferase involved in cell wall biosynthesis
MPKLYTMANVLVIPSHGEGWGRPHVEAMSCECPVIATAWSGPTEYLNSNNGFPLNIENKLVKAGNWNGHLWAEPSLNHLQELMRYTYLNPIETKMKGIQARKDIIDSYSLLKMGNVVKLEIDRITNIINNRN